MSDVHDETRARLREQADKEFGSAWIPGDAGEELVGVITAIKPAVHTSYGHVPVVELEELGSHVQWSLWLLHTVLRREVWRARPAVGETMLVRYLGRVHPDGGGPAYESYKVVVDRPDEGNEIDWQAIANRYDPETLDAEASVPASAPAPDRTSSEDEIPY
jgi:hypothetical protein